MPDFIVELTHTTGRGRADQRSVTVKDADTPNVATVLAVEELLKWSLEDDSPIPRGALEYWQTCRNTGSVQLYEIFTTLDTKYQLSFNVRESVSQTAPQQEVPAQRSAPFRRNGTSGPQPPPPSRPRDFKEMLAEQLDFLQSRQKELLAERKRINDEYEENAASLADIRNFLMVAATRKPRRKKEQANADQEA
jgi:hypothetical protein